MLASWRNEWQEVLRDYQEEIESKFAAANSTGDADESASNPLRNRATLQSQLQSIEQLSGELERIEEGLKRAKDELVAKSADIAKNGMQQLAAEIQADDLMRRKQQQERMSLNLEALRKEMFASMIRQAMHGYHVSSNLVARSSQLIGGDLKYGANRGVNLVDRFTTPGKLHINSLEMIAEAKPMKATSLRLHFTLIQAKNTRTTL